MGISLSKVEIESLCKSFFLFFVSLAGLSLLFFNYILKDKMYDLEENLYTQMKIAGLNLKSSSFKITIVERQNQDLSTFHSDQEDVYAFFKHPNFLDKLVKVSYPKKNILKDKELIEKELYTTYFQILIIIFILSILFSLYALYPLKKSLSLTNEFVKDILHDFNTPISTIRLNTSILKTKQTNKNIQRIESGVDTILNLQNNLKSYISDDIKESVEFDLKEFIYQRVDYMKGIYPNITFNIDITNKTLYCSKDGFLRILDNILSNACKYNKKEGSVSIVLNSNNILEINDTGKGIKNTSKIFNRFYKETSRGLGIGLHIVKKISNKMGIDISVQSELKKGTNFQLNISKLIYN